MTLPPIDPRLILLTVACAIALQGLYIMDKTHTTNYNMLKSGEDLWVGEVNKVHLNIIHYEEPEDIIRTMAELYGVREDTALRISYCESRHDPMAKNKTSSASGLFQFTRGTWEGYCEGEVFNARDNARCFMELYPLHPTWWECR